MSQLATAPNTTETTDDNAAMRPAGAIPRPDGTMLWPDGSGGYMPEDRIKTELKIEDEMVRKMIGYAKALHDQIERFKRHSFADIADYQSLLDQHYGGTKGGAKGNVTFTSFDGLLQVKVAVADINTYGPQLQTAKKLIDECLNEWSADSRPEIQTIVTRAFNTDQEGRVNSAELDRLRRYDIIDPRWLKAMEAIADARRSVGTKEYVRFFTRPTVEDRFEAITIDLASA